MDIYTMQLRQIAAARKEKMPFENITVLSGNRAFAPTWDMVRKIKENTLSPEDYTEQYLALMEESKVIYPKEWERLLAMDTVALGCYCRPNTFCHRHLLKDIFEKMCTEKELPFHDMGEWVGKTA